MTAARVASPEGWQVSVRFRSLGCGREALVDGGWGAGAFVKDG